MKVDEVYSNAVVVEGLKIAESSKYNKYTQDAMDIYKAAHGVDADAMFEAAFGHVISNFEQHVATLSEGTTQASMPFLQDYGFELITALMPGLIANDIFTTQPAKFKTYSIFYQDFQYGTTKSQITAGDPSITALDADVIDENYTRDEEVERIIGTGNGITANYTVAASVLFVPVIASTVIISAVDTGGDTLVVTDDGSGALVGDVDGGGTNTIDYTTGAIDVTFERNIDSQESVYLSYEFVGEGSKPNAAEFNMNIAEITGQAKERRLRYNFSIESQFSYRQQFGRSMDADLLAASVSEIRKEIDQDLILAGRQAAFTLTGDNASAGSITWDRTPPTGVQYFFHRETFIDALVEAQQLITDGVGISGAGNQIVGGSNFATVVKTLGPRFKASGISGVKGSYFIGTIDDTMRCYYEPTMGANEFFMTHKGSWLEVSLVYSPWMPLFTSDPHMLADGKLHRYLITSSGQKVVNPKMFVKGTLIKTTS